MPVLCKNVLCSLISLLFLFFARTLNLTDEPNTISTVLNVCRFVVLYIIAFGFIMGPLLFQRDKILHNFKQLPQITIRHNVKSDGVIN